MLVGLILIIRVTLPLTVVHLVLEGTFYLVAAVLIERLVLEHQECLVEICLYMLKMEVEATEMLFWLMMAQMLLETSASERLQ